MSTALEVIVPGLTALAGGALGARWSAVSVEHAELRSLLDDATATLSRAGQARGRAWWELTIGDDPPSRDFPKALAAFRSELSHAEQLRGQIVFRARTNSPVSVHYLNTLLALGRTSVDLGVAAMSSGPPLSPELQAKMTADEATFSKEHGLFLEAAHAYFKPTVKQRLRRLSRPRRL
jgi:hypothetical protein